MCGICGVFEYAGRRDVTEEALRAMAGTLRHRGPDDEGITVQGQAGLAVRRLSVIDVAGGHQPIVNEDGTVWIVFNGEIYNFEALSRELQAKGHHFKTRTDTEAVLHLYEEFGKNCVDHLDGMFAFAIYDSRPSEQGPKLLLARDRFGKKPLYYASLDGVLLFGSEIKPLLLDDRLARDLDPVAIHHYLSLLMIPAPLTIFAAVRKLPAGHLLVCDQDGPRVEKYWSFADRARERAVPRGEAVRRIRELLVDAVQKRLVSAVPVGAFLSGGLDSSAVVGLMSRLTGHSVETFSVGFEGPSSHNELPDAKVAARHFGANHHALVLKPDVAELVETLVRHTDEPFAISSALPLLLLSRAARKHVTVVLTGDGGDETFGGYDYYRYERWAVLYRRVPVALDGILMRAAALLGGRAEFGRGRWRIRVERFVAAARKGPAERRLRWASGFTEEEKRALYSPSFAARELEATWLFLEAAVPALGLLDPVTALNALDFHVFLPDEMLAKVDRATMAASVEARCPLLDRDLVEYLASLPFDMKVPGSAPNDLKSLLREAVADFLPAELKAKRKHGFNVPLDVWFRSQASGYVRAKLAPDRLRARGIFDPAQVQALVASHMRGEINAGNRLFALLVLEAWAEAYLPLLPSASDESRTAAVERMDRTR